MHAKFLRVSPKADLTKCAVTELITTGLYSHDPVNPGGLTPFFVKPRSDRSLLRQTSHHRQRGLQHVEGRELTDQDYLDFSLSLIHI